MISRTLPTTFLVLCISSLGAACGKRAPDPVTEASRQAATERAKVPALRACETELLALDLERATLDERIRNLTNERQASEGVLSAARARPTPDPATVAEITANIERIDVALLRARAERTALEPRMDARRRECDALRAASTR